MRNIFFVPIRTLRRAGAGSILMALALAATSLAERRGEWRIESRPERGRVQVELHYSEGGWTTSTGRTLPLSALVGLSQTQLAAGVADVRFRLVRDAGAFDLAGRLENGRGGGTWSFEPDPEFSARLARRGYSRPTDVQQFQLALEDVGEAYLDELEAQGYRRPSTENLVRMGNHGVGLAYLRGMGARGLHLGDPDALVELRDHGVDPKYIDGLDALGYRGLDARALTRLRDHGVDPRYIEGLRGEGLLRLDTQQLLMLRDHGVDPEFIAGFRRLGYRLAADQLVELRDHGVDPRFASGLASAGFPGLSPAELKRARDHGVDVSFARRARARYPERRTIEEVIELKDRGVR